MRELLAIKTLVEVCGELGANEIDSRKAGGAPRFDVEGQMKQIIGAVRWKRLEDLLNIAARRYVADQNRRGISGPHFMWLWMPLCSMGMLESIFVGGH